MKHKERKTMFINIGSYRMQYSAHATLLNALIYSSLVLFSICFKLRLLLAESLMSLYFGEIN